MLATIRSTHGLQRFMLFAGFGIVIFFILLAIFAHWIAPYGFNTDRAAGVVFGTQKPPSAAHWFGTTVGGQDVASRVIYGARTAVIVIAVAVSISIVIGVPIGLVSGYLGGILDRALVLVMDAMYAFPPLLLAIVVSIIVGGGQSGLITGMFAAAISITVIFIPQYFRVVRNATVSVKAEPYVDAARVVGARTHRIMFKHILSNVAGTLPVIATLNASEAILTLAGLGFLGLGIEPSAAAEWGYDLNKALPDATNGIWWTGVYPGLAIVAIVLGVTLVGESLNDVLNPLLRTRAGGQATADETEIASEFDAAVQETSPDTAGNAEGQVAARTAESPERLRIATLSLDELTVEFDTDAGTVHAVRDIGFAVDPGEVVAVVGESGSGKSVSSRAVLGLLPSTAHVSGSAKLRDRELLGLPQGALRPIRGNQVSMIFQEASTALNPVYTVGWQITEGLRAHQNMSKKQAATRAVELLDMVGLPDPEHRFSYYPHQLSGGQKQRVVIAMAIACDPDVIIADEPTTALDVTVQAAILELLLSLRDRLGTSIVLITHNMGVVADIADRVVVMYQGQIVEQQDVHTLFSAPQHPYTQRLLDAVPHLGAGTGGELEHADDSRPVLAMQNLVVEFPGRIGQPPVRAVDDVSLAIHPGEVLGLVGESGSGKTTVGRTAVGLQPATSGSVQVNGTEIAGLSDAQLRPHRRRLGFVFQDPATSLNPHMSIADCIGEPLYVEGTLSAADRRAKVEGLLDRVQLLAGYADRYPHELSGGQRQRVSLARSLALDPDLLIADEPTSALDVSVQARVLELFTELQSELQFGCLFISHDLAVIDTLANRVAVMQYGKMVEIGSRDQVLTNPQDSYTERLIAAVPVPDPAEQQRRREERGKLLTDVS